MTFTRQMFWAIVSTIFIVVLILVMLLVSLQRDLQRKDDEINHTKQSLQALEQATCEQNTAWIANTTSQFFIESSGGMRTYNVHTPANFSNKLRYPLIIAYDGMDGSARQIESYSSLNQLPALVVYPQAVIGTHNRTAWQGAPYSQPGVSDIDFTRDIINQVSDSYCVNQDKIYTVGMSNGGAFAWLATCQLPEYIKASVSISGAYYSNCEAPNHAPSLIIHSRSDTQIPFKGSKHRHLPAVYQLAEERAASEKCSPKPIMKEQPLYRQYRWTKCSNKSRVELLILRDEPHGWLEMPRSSTILQSQTTAQYIWKFLNEQ